MARGRTAAVPQQATARLSSRPRLTASVTTPASRGRETANTTMNAIALTKTPTFTLASMAKPASRPATTPRAMAGQRCPGAGPRRRDRRPRSGSASNGSSQLIARAKARVTRTAAQGGRSRTRHVEQQPDEGQVDGRRDNERQRARWADEWCGFGKEAQRPVGEDDVTAEAQALCHRLVQTELPGNIEGQSAGSCCGSARPGRG